MTLELLIPIISVAAGYWIGTQTHGEVSQGKRFLLGITFVLALIVLVTLLFGTGTFAPGGIASLELLSIFGVFLGTLIYARKAGIIGVVKPVKKVAAKRRK